MASYVSFAIILICGSEWHKQHGGCEKMFTDLDHSINVYGLCRVCNDMLTLS